MRLRHNPKARPELAECRFFIDEPERHRGSWRELFSKDNPFYIELGCGKGEFISNYARNNQDKNFLGIDIKSEILLYSKRNIESVYENRTPDNLLLTAFDIARIERILCGSDAVDGAFISFCNPWPKNQHKKRRLTHARQLAKYRDFLKNDAPIFFRTDDRELFFDSATYFEKSGFEIIERSENYPVLPEFPLSEHERMFRAEGKKIYYIEARII